MTEFNVNDQHHTLTIHSNTAELDRVIDAVNELIRIEVETQAKEQGLELNVDTLYSKQDLLRRYSYRRFCVRPKWYRHTFTPKPQANVPNQTIV